MATWYNGKDKPPKSPRMVWGIGGNMEVAQLCYYSKATRKWFDIFGDNVYEIQFYTDVVRPDVTEIKKALEGGDDSA